MGPSPTGGVVFPGLHNFFVFVSSSAGMARVTHVFFSQTARTRATWTQFLLLPLPLAQATSRQLFSSALSPPCNRHRGDSNTCGQSPVDFKSISLAARTQCLLPALCSPLSFGKHLLELLIGGAHLRPRALSLPLHGCLATSTARPKRSND